MQLVQLKIFNNLLSQVTKYMKNLKWYLGRLKAMSIKELGYRVNITLVNFHASRRLGKNTFKSSISTFKTLLNPGHVETKKPANQIRIFDKYFEINENINWHLDPHSGKEFPKIFSRKIDTRGFNNMSAKHVWEINRMLFLPILSIHFNDTNKMDYLTLFSDIISSWKKNNPYMVGLNWYSNIELSIRLINWAISWDILNVPELIKKNERFKRFVEEDWLPIIYLHCKRISATFSKYSSANNHLIAELAGLFISSTLWEFNESRKWREIAKKGLEKEIQIQYSNNGVNREEASGYIQFITDFFIISSAYAKKSNNDFSDAYYNRIDSICNYMYDLLDIKGNVIRYGDEDDGNILFFYQDDFENNFKSILSTGTFLFSNSKYKAKSIGFDLKNRILFGESAKLEYDIVNTKSIQETSSIYPDEGHFFLRKTKENREILCHFDAAPLGYLSIAAHGHADALSFILHVDGRPIIVDNGTYTYHTDHSFRKYFKGTLAHNTIRVDKQDQSKYDGPSLWSEHFNCKVLEHNTSPEKDEIFAQHDGYRKFGINHFRKIIFEKDKNRIVIIDNMVVENDNEHFLEMCYHLSPEVISKAKGENSFLIESADNRIVQITIDNQFNTEVINGKLEPILGFYSSGFRKIQPTSVIYGSAYSRKTISFKTEILIIEK